MGDVSRTVANKLAVLLIVVVVATVLLTGMSVLTSVDVTVDDFRSSGEVTATEGTLYLDRVGQPTVVGEIENDYGQAISDVIVSATFHEDGEEIGTVEEAPFSSAITDDSTIPYEVKLNESGEPNDVSVSVSHDDAETLSTDLIVTDHEEIHRNQDSVIISGTVENTDDSAVSQPTVVLTFYDENGTVIGARSDQVSSGSLEAGETNHFTVQYETLGDIPSLAREYADYDVDVVPDEQT